MPTYEYECQKCHRHFEEFQKMTDPPLKQCPVCHGRLVRLISGGAGLIFKGSGFYITDYKKTSISATDKKEKPPQEKKEKTAAAPQSDQTAGGSAASGKKEKKETKTETKK